MQESYYDFLNFRKKFFQEYYFIWENYKCEPILDTKEYLERCGYNTLAQLGNIKSFFMFGCYNLEILKRFDNTKLYSLLSSEADQICVMVCRPSKDYHIWFKIKWLPDKEKPRYIVDPLIMITETDNFFRFLDENQDLEIKPSGTNMGAAGIFHK